MATQKKKLDNILILAIIELLIVFAGMLLQGIVVPLVSLAIPANDPVLSEFINLAVTLGSFIFVILICFLFMRLNRPESLGVFKKGTVKQRLRSLGLGLLIGLGMNGLISLIVVFSGSVELSFNGFSVYLIAILPFCFIQCTAEEFVLRGFIPSYLEETHKWDSIAFVSGTLFIFHHVANISMIGFNVLFCLNVFLMGVLLYLMVRINGNFWIACGIHTAWNFTQQFLFGLPNSGQSSGIGLFRGGNETATFFFDPAYGNEGSILTTIVLLVIVCLLAWKETHKKIKAAN